MVFMPLVYQSALLTFTIRLFGQLLLFLKRVEIHVTTFFLFTNNKTILRYRKKKGYFMVWRIQGEVRTFLLKVPC